VDVRRKRRVPRGLALDLHHPAAPTQRLDQRDGTQALACAKAPRGPREGLPTPPAEALHQQHFDRAARLPAKLQARSDDPRVVDDRQVVLDELGKIGECTVFDGARRPSIDEEPRRVPPLGRPLRDELGREVVVELGGVHPARRVASPPMDAYALERAKQRIADAAAGRPEPAALEAALERSRDQIEALAATAAELEASIPAHVGLAVHDGLRTEVLPVARHIAEIRGLLNQAIRRLERLEGDLLAERHARVDDLALLVDLVSSGWRGVDARLARLEAGTPVEPVQNGRVEALATSDAVEHDIEHAAAA
jgi:hypothetical protein